MSVRAALLPALCLLVLLGLPAGLSAQTYGVSVTPDGSTVSNKTTHSTDHTQIFQVTNTGSWCDPLDITCQAATTFTISCVGASNVTCTNWPASVQVQGGSSQNITVTYSTGNEGTGQVHVTASNSFASDQGYIIVPVVLPAGAPRMSVLPYLEAKQDFSRCAVGCFAATYAQNTVPYLSLDAPRNVTLVYHGDRVAPRPFVLVDVRPDSSFGSWPGEYQLKVKVNGSFVTFLNGEQTLRFSNPANLTYRIGGQFTPPALTHGDVRAMEVLVSAKIGANFYENRWITQYLHIDEAANPVARGWSLAGIQRAFITAGTGVLVTEGDGSATYFRYNPVSLKYEGPTGDFSTLVQSGSTLIRAWPDSTKVTFNSSGEMVRVSNAWGVRDTILYASGKVTQIRDHLNNRITLAYGANGLSTITDTLSRTTTVTVNANKTLASIKDPDNVSTSFGYDGSLRLQTITNRAGATTTLAYDSQSGKLGTVTSPVVAVFGQGNVAPVTTLAAWQKRGVPYVATAGTPFTPIIPDSAWGSVTEPGGAVTRFRVNRWGSPALTVAPHTDTTRITYSFQGLPVKVVRPGNSPADADTMAWNGSGLLTYQKLAGQNPTNLRYAAFAQADSIWGTGQPTIRRVIGANGRVTEVRVGGVTVSQFTYDSYGRVLTEKDGKGTTILTNSYPGSGQHRNLSSTTLPGNRTTSYGYGAFGRRTTVSPPLLPTQTTYYSSINRVDSVKVATSPATLTKYQYNNLYLTKVTDPKSQVYEFTWNALGWLTARKDPVLRSEAFQYTRDGNLARYTNRRSQNVDFGYDQLHRMTSRSGSTSLSWSYSVAGGRVITGTSPTSTETLYLNVRGQPDSVKTVMASQTYWRRYRYTAAGLPDSLVVTGGGISTFQGRRYLWDEPKGLLTTLRVGGRSTTFAYDANQQDTSRTLPGGDRRRITFGSLHAPLRLTSTGSLLAPHMERWLNLDGLGRLDMQLTYESAVGRFYHFDGLSRLAKGRNREAVTPAPPPEWCAEGFAPPGSCLTEPSWVTVDSTVYGYDAVGNRTSQGGTYGTGNRITAFDGCTYTTDFDGQVTGRSGGGCSAPASFAWNAEGQLDSLHTGSTGVKFLYDAFGRLVAKRVNGTMTARFLWDGAGLVAELSGAGTAKTAEYSYYPGLDRLHAVVVGTTAYYAHADGLGNTIVLADSAQRAKRVYGYGDWGALASGWDSLPGGDVNRARWKGALWLGPEAEVYYLRARWYEPRTGRFLSEDPLHLAGGINPTVFAGNDPVNGADPTGALCEWRQYTVTVSGVGSTQVHTERYLWCDGGTSGGLNPRVPFNPFAPLGGGGNGSGVPGSGPNPTALGRDGPSCGAALALLGLNAVSDAAFLYGAGALVRLGAYAHGTSRIAAGLAREPLLRGLAPAHVAAHDVLFRHTAAGGTALIAAEIASSQEIAAYTAAAGASVSTWDFLPLAGTFRALAGVDRACFK